MRKPSVIVDLRCEACGATFQQYPSRIARGYGKYCSKGCYAIARAGQKRELRPFQMQPTEKVCIVCGKTFLVGGRGRPKRDQEVCGVDCQRASRYRRGERAKELTIPDAAYLAGLIDGEGSVMVVTHHAAFAIKLAIANTDRPILEWVERATGIGLIIGTRKETDRHRAGWIWHVHGEGAESLLEQVVPYIKIKATQAAMALDFHGRLRVPALKADRTWQAEWRLRMQALNKRGPRAAPDE